MNPLNQFEYEQRLLSELQELFEFASPATLRRSIEDVYFNLLTAQEEITISREVSHYIYLLINFLNEVEEMKR